MAADLFAPIEVGAWKLANRIVMAPMTRSRAGAGDAATPLMAQYYAQRASAGLVVAEASQISPEGQGYVGTPGIYSAAQVDGWRRVTNAVHAAGGTIVLQLWHVGRIAHPDNKPAGAGSVAPSALAAEVKVFTPNGLFAAPVPHALTAGEIERLIGDYAQAARNALAAGFDGIELHAANGYLIDQFLQDGANRRTDDHGGAIGNRCRLLFEVCDRLIGVVGTGRLGVRLSPFGVFNGISDSDPAALLAAAMAGLSQRALAYLHVVNQEVSGDRNTGLHEVDVAAFARRHYSGTLVVAGGYGAESAQAVLSAGGAEMVAFGRPFIANPDLVQRLRSGASLATGDRATYYTEGPAGYTDYATAPGAAFTRE
jgi:N-ethylmaleimide reductase